MYYQLQLVCVESVSMKVATKQPSWRLIGSGGFRAARLPGQATCTARMVSLWVENPFPPPNRQALDWSVVLTVGQ